MISRRFAVVLLWSTLFFGTFIHFAVAEVVQAYRTPSEADLQWLFGDSPTPIPSDAGPSVVVQAGYVSKKTHMLAPHTDPCRPAKLPSPPIPPAPTSAYDKMNTGLVAEEEGVVSITTTVLDSIAPVVQMSDRLPPPSEVPKERERTIGIPLAEPAEPLPAVEEKERPLDSPSFPNASTGCGGFNFAGKRGSCGDFDSSGSPCYCITCILIGNHRKSRKDASGGCATTDDEDWLFQLDETYKKCETTFYVPDMLGSSAWLAGYSVGTGGIPPTTFKLPTMLLTRPNVAERFSADVQNRIWADYRHWNNAVSLNEGILDSRAVEQFFLGFERQVSKNSAIELRMPIVYQFGSGEDFSIMAVELGNISVFAKQVMKRTTQWTFSAGVGATLPTAENWRPFGSARLKNNAYYLVSFLGAQWHPSSTTFGHIALQADMPIEKNVLESNTGEEKVKGQQVIRAGVLLGNWIYRADHGKRPCRFGAFAEVNYAVVVEGSPELLIGSGNDTVYVDEFKSGTSTLTAAIGMPMVFGDLTCTNSLILPILGNNRPFNAGYGLSLSRRF